jgi:hypothetical protein
LFDGGLFVARGDNDCDADRSALLLLR